MYFKKNNKPKAGSHLHVYPCFYQQLPSSLTPGNSLLCHFFSSSVFCTALHVLSLQWLDLNITNPLGSPFPAGPVITIKVSHIRVWFKQKALLGHELSGKSNNQGFNRICLQPYCFPEIVRNRMPLGTKFWHLTCSDFNFFLCFFHFSYYLTLSSCDL